MSNGLVVKKGRVQCAACQRSVITLATFKDEIWLTCKGCRRSWAKPLGGDPSEIITLMGHDKD